jgi:hypothetical protein
MPVVGSSSSNIFASTDMALNYLHHPALPQAEALHGSRGSISILKWERQLVALLYYGVFVRYSKKRLRGYAPRNIFSPTVSPFTRLSSWYMAHMPDGRRFIGSVISTFLPSIYISPWSARCTPVSILISVGFTGAVFSQQRMHLALLQLEVDIAQSMDTAKSFGYVFQLQ